MNHSIMSTATLLAATLSPFLIAGCADAPKPAAVPTTAVAVQFAVPLAPAAPGKTNSTVYLSDRLRAACGITSVGTIQDTPKFDYDRSAILPEDRDVLALVAQCLTTGALRGRTVQFVGRADPRGTQDYNMALGERRANSVMRYVAALGVAASQMTETSRGALDATGTEATAWRQDRRVDIDLVG